jgi:hypothetical protein
MARSSSNDSSGVTASDNADAEAEDTIVMNLHESAWSYDFGASSVTVFRG